MHLVCVIDTIRIEVEDFAKHICQFFPWDFPWDVMEWFVVL